MRLRDLDLRTRILPTRRSSTGPRAPKFWLVLGLSCLSCTALGEAHRARSQSAATAPEQHPSEPPPLSFLTRAQSYKLLRFSSYDRSGGNADSRHLPAGETLTLVDTRGPGTV